jgi:hypothetical protein
MSDFEEDIMGEDGRHYSSILGNLWESYIKAVNLGLLMNGLSIAFIFGLIADREKFKFIESMSDVLGLMAPKHVIGFIVFILFMSGFILLCSRISSQIIMERQVYGDRGRAVEYFKSTSTTLPFALRIGDKMLARVAAANDLLVWSGAFLLIFAWLLAAILVASYLFA